MSDTDFRKMMRESESSGSYGILTDIDGGRQVSGAYQFGDARLNDYKKETGEQFDREKFLRDPDLQERVMNWHEQDIIKYVMDNALDQYLGQEVKGVEVDPPALTAMAHLGGNYGMRRFLESGGEYDPEDKFGTLISDYGKKFSGLNMYGLTPMRPKMRPEGLGGMEASLRPQARPEGLLPAAAPQRNRRRGLID